MHIILCRNVLIYFNAETIQAVARRLYDTLAPGGWLLTAASDPPLAAHAPFETVTTDAGVLYRRLEEGKRGRGEEGKRRSEETTTALAPMLFPVVPAPVLFPVVSAPALFPLEKSDLVPSSPLPLIPSSPPPVSEPAPAADPLAEARQALADGDYRRAAALTRDRPDDEAACVLHVRASPTSTRCAANKPVRRRRRGGRCRRSCTICMGFFW